MCFDASGCSFTAATGKVGAAGARGVIVCFDTSGCSFTAAAGKVGAACPRGVIVCLMQVAALLLLLLVRLGLLAPALCFC